MKEKRGIFSMLAYPFSRPASEVAESLRGISREWSAVQEERRRKRVDYEAANAGLGDVTAKEKFEKIYEINNWTPEELRDQHRTLVVTRLGLLVLAAISMTTALALVWVLSWWVMALLAPALVVASAASCALALRYAWWEHQIETRSITSMRSFLSREDLFSRLFRWRRPV